METTDVAEGEGGSEEEERIKVIEQMIVLIHMMWLVPEQGIGKGGEEVEIAVEEGEVEIEGEVVGEEEVEIAIGEEEVEIAVGEEEVEIAVGEEEVEMALGEGGVEAEEEEDLDSCTFIEWNFHI